MIDFEKEFRITRGQPFTKNGTAYRMVYSLNAGDQGVMNLRFVSGIESPLQGIRLDCSAEMTINGKRSHAFELWYGHAPEVVEVKCLPNAAVSVRNIWDYGDGVVESWHAGGAMRVEDQPTGSIKIFCNSTLKNDACRDLIVELRSA